MKLSEMKTATNFERLSRMTYHTVKAFYETLKGSQCFAVPEAERKRGKGYIDSINEMSEEVFGHFCAVLRAEESEFYTIEDIDNFVNK